MGLHCLAFMGRNLEIKKKMTLIQTTKSVGMNSKNVVNDVGISMIVLVLSVNNTWMNNILCE